MTELFDSPADKEKENLKKQLRTYLALQLPSEVFTHPQFDLDHYIEGCLIEIDCLVSSAKLLYDHVPEWDWVDEENKSTFTRVINKDDIDDLDEDEVEIEEYVIEFNPTNQKWIGTQMFHGSRHCDQSSHTKEFISQEAAKNYYEYCNK